MILEIRKWRLIFPGLAVIVTTLLILGFSGPVSYALQDDTPHPIYGPRGLDKNRLDGRFGVLRAQTGLDRAVALHRDGRTSYWVPVRGYTDKEGGITLFVLTDDIHGPNSSGNNPTFDGRLVRFDEAPHAADAEKAINAALNDAIAPNTYVLIEGDAPKTYRPMVPLVGGLGLIWFLSLVSFTRVWRGTPRRRR